MSRSGVPQGFNLGSLLFVLFINDLIIIVGCLVLAYTHDLKIFQPIFSTDKHRFSAIQLKRSPSLAVAQISGLSNSLNLSS